MKKLLLATIIASTSFGAAATDSINDKETKRNLLNDNLQYAERTIANIGGKDVTFSNMIVAEDGNFSAIITHKDEHGNDIERTVSYQMDGSNNDAIRDAVVEHAKNAPIIDPINHKETKRNLLNDNLQYAERNIANIGGKDVTFSNMMVAEDGNFSAIITHKDEHGNDIERTVSYQMDGSNNDAIRDAVVEHAKNAPIIDPINHKETKRNLLND
ncbi:hypothetical protein C9J22_20055, partial [Photobacterium phosphoreum]|uniref:hypothetical protein n=1 Tax=Photobacterium phosphoreum TaxID=659 RepID=UPI000D470C5D